MKVSPLGSGYQIELSGVADESSNLSPAPFAKNTALQLDLKDFVILNSSGFRLWFFWLKSLESPSIELLNCSPELVEQIVALEEALPKNVRLTSLEVPYQCSSCGEQFEILAHRGQDFQENTGTEPAWSDVAETRACPHCHKAASIAAPPLKYFSFLKKLWS
jgi:rubredoxin